MKDLHGNEIDAPVFNDPHGRKVDHKGNPIARVFGEVKHGVEEAGEGIKKGAETPFGFLSHLEHDHAPAEPAEPAKTETPAEVPAAPEVKAETPTTDQKAE